MSEPQSDRRRGRIVSIVLALVTAAIGVWAFHDLRVRHEISQFIPSSEDRELADVARQVIDSELSRTIVIAIRAEDEPTSIAAARTFADRLRTIEGVAWVRSGPPAEVERAFYELYFARRYAFFADTPEEARAHLSDDALRVAAVRLEREVTGPTAMLVRRVAQEDPLLAFLDHLRRLQGSAEGGPRVIDGQLVSQDGWALVLLASEAPSFDTARIGPLLDAIDRETRALIDAHGGSLRVEQAGVHRFARRAEHDIREDVQRISTLSTLGVVVLFLALYRGPRFLLLGGIPLAVGTVAATAACRLVFGSVHGITFAFGSSLLGVGIDYVSHYVNHHVLEPDARGPEATMRTIWPGLALGASTTIAGLAGLGWTAFPGMREMALFAAVGVTAALLSTRVMVPPWMPMRSEPPRITRAAADVAFRLWRRLQSHRAPFLALPIVALVIAAIGIPQLAWVDDIRALNQADPEWLAEDAAVRSRVAQGEAGRLVIATGRDDEEALARAERAFEALTRARDAGELRAFRSAHHLVRSIATQRGVDDAVRNAPALADRTITALEREGFVPSMFEPFRASLAAPAPEPLTYEALMASPIADLVRPFRVHLSSDRVAYLAFVEGVSDSAALRARLASLEGVAYFDQGEFLASAYREFRARTLELLAVGMLVVLGLCVARYRSVRLGLASVAPALLAAATALGVLGLLGEPANLMHLVGALLVLSMAEDFAVFLIESRDDPRGVATTMVGITVACITTVISFGLLAASTHPAMRALGLMASVGVGLALVFSPMALLLAGTRKPS
ncbi:MMPL family transporter [Sandaracinus amylolyticus]|uniref:MMPL family transporter n=1 Tax=Sandaracinus amylolyticus TaxID=927083 RepID=UPI00069E0626|nr:MMPL family transporter [Sandaracinus amylolyticus]